VIENSPNAYVVWDRDLIFVSCNRMCRGIRSDLEHLLKPGLPYEDLFDVTLSDIIIDPRRMM